MAAKDLLPGEVLKILSSHGQVSAMLGGVSARCDIAPFEDRVVLFIRPGTDAARALLSSNKAEIRATVEDRSYSVHLKGRAVLGRRAHMSGRSAELVHWVPEGSKLPSFISVAFYAEEVEYYRGNERFHGKTEAAKVPSFAARWRQVAFWGAMPQLAIGLTGVWAFIIVKGSGLMFRWLALLLAAAVVILSIGGAQCWYRSALFSRWREGGSAKGAELMVDGLLAPGPVTISAYVYTALAVLLIAPLKVWGTDVMLVTAAASMMWFQWPLNLSKVFTGDTAEEKRER
ncbi:MAG: hypothetical protein GY913_08350 [Proteobacteria bacterium]|nr:hypothetical protein [Pseudomonadota bacterium]MCP4916920.1 hypothetical protein [Pseudomonadota bacterium]